MKKVFSKKDLENYPFVRSLYYDNNFYSDDNVIKITSEHAISLGYITEDNYFHVLLFEVEKGFHRKGYGAKLLNTIEKYAIDHDIKVISLISYNKDSDSFYRAQGFFKVLDQYYKNI